MLRFTSTAILTAPLIRDTKRNSSLFGIRIATSGISQDFLHVYRQVFTSLIFSAKYRFRAFYAKRQVLSNH